MNDPDIATQLRTFLETSMRDGYPMIEAALVEIVSLRLQLAEANEEIEGLVREQLVIAKAALKQ